MNTETGGLCQRCGSFFRMDSLHEGSPVSVDTKTLLFLAQTSWRYVCPSCIKEIENKISLLTGSTFPKSNELRENVDYYYEKDFLVFTEHYLLLRGSCCKSGCRHCPYGFRK